jgi:hypothetical protein
MYYIQYTTGLLTLISVSFKFAFHNYVLNFIQQPVK